MALLEVIALDARDAVAAHKGGADRVELVVDMGADGLSPSPATVADVRAAVDIPVRVMLRLTGGFAPGDLGELVRCTVELRSAGAQEFVLGFLTADGAVDLPAVTRVVEAIDGAPWTFHRAIDHCADRAALRSTVAELPGLDGFLTAGAAAGLDDGIATLIAEASGPQRILAGGGLRLDHLPRLEGAGIDAFHIGSAARPQGWESPVSAEAVRTWRAAVDDQRP
ncbi:copper homeostasis protein CutC [Tsukamurella ocularis]|uniref:copper homeostasis protein CutC n=1 Tax=Tsukamurella ocularis TaxID=1970234 RepID=UPI002168B882|nr:copper homeostasis protein CutC [Tsukamurella ocularis]MCS3781314.1 copper homeostasis protein [Tsukamurella ocularis]MCS3787685.1 copper homeostasis protein [Tsukamurella ocularis]MCS3850980.1 copper homeostasis protein [Tsukamurella ocularis]